MALITLSYDTNDKKVSCSIDGSELDEMAYFCLSQYSDEPYLEISFEPKKENGVTTYTRVIASENKKISEETVAFSKDKTLVKINGKKDYKQLFSEWIKKSV